MEANPQRTTHQYGTIDKYGDRYTASRDTNPAGCRTSQCGNWPTCRSGDDKCCHTNQHSDLRPENRQDGAKNRCPGSRGDSAHCAGTPGKWYYLLPGIRSNFGSCSEDRKSTRLNSSHSQISYAVF